ncbi:MAG: tripartite tricarboxylate transporter TctB family protein [Pseudomonadales bacterium]|nr:tripartite tricarboxylate transporter TctB family protein [Pseudomonadales bacterium]
MTGSRIGGVLFLVLCLGYGYYAGEIQLDFFSQQEPFNARSMPQMIAVAGIVISILLIVTPSTRTDWAFLKDLNWKPALLLLALMALYGAVFDYLGYAIATVLFLVAAFIVLGERRPTRMLLVSIPVTFGFWGLMYLLGISLSPGALILDFLAGQA